MNGRNNYKRTQFPNGLLLLFIVLSIFPIVSAVNLDTGTILNTSESNSSMTFSVPITVDNFVINATTITLNTIICSNGANPITQINWAVPNANNDSASYCYVAPPAPAPSNPACAYGLAGTLNLILIASTLFLFFIVLNLLYSKGILQNITLEGIIYTFVGVAIGIALLISVGNSIVGICPS